MVRASQGQATSDNLTRQPPHVYEAMAASLGQAWRDLQLLLDRRRELLDLAVAFFRALEEELTRVQLAADRLAVSTGGDPPTDLPAASALLSAQLEQHRELVALLQADTGAHGAHDVGAELIQRIYSVASELNSSPRLATAAGGAVDVFQRAANSACVAVDNSQSDLLERQRALQRLCEEMRARLELRSRLLQLLLESQPARTAHSIEVEALTWDVLTCPRTSPHRCSSGCPKRASRRPAAAIWASRSPARNSCSSSSTLSPSTPQYT